MDVTRDIPMETGDSPMLYYSSGSVGPYTMEHEYDRFTLVNYTLGRSAANTVQTWYGLNGTQHFVSTERKRPVYNDCSNRIIRTYNFPYGATFRNYVIPTTVYWNPYRRFGLYSHYKTYVEGADTSVSWSSAESARRRAVWHMKPRFEGRVQLLNALFELKDFRDIMKYLVKINFVRLGEAFRDLRGLISKECKRRKIGDPTVGMIPQLLSATSLTTKVLASGLLTKRLAIDPTLADAASLLDQMEQTVMRQQSDFAKRGTTPQRSHYTEQLDKSVALESTPGSNYYWVRAYKQNTTKFTATSEYLYKYKMRNRSEAVRRAYGLNLTASVVWNALPFTWIADYFIGIGDSIQAMEADPNVALLPLQYCESILREAESGYELHEDPRCFWVCLNGHMQKNAQGRSKICGYVASTYVRRVVEPSFGPALPRLRWPSEYQQQTLAALVRCWI